MSTIISPEDLEKAGYRQYKIPLGKELADRFYQRWIRHQDPDYTTGTVKLYALDWFWYDYRKVDRLVELGTGWMVHARMYRGEESWDLGYMVWNHYTIEHVERFYQNTYVTLGCTPDPHND